MSLKNLDNLVNTGQLKIEPFNDQEFAGLIRSGQARLKDAFNAELAEESRFDLAYNAAHSLALAALRRQGYRPQHRYLVFQLLPFTLDISKETSRVLAKCHDCRNLAEYEGHLEINNQLLKELLAATQLLLDYLK